VEKRKGEKEEKEGKGKINALIISLRFGKRGRKKKRKGGPHPPKEKRGKGVGATKMIPRKKR